MTFEWDEDKRQSNIKKHEIDFKNITNKYFDKCITIQDSRSYDENRYISYSNYKSRIYVTVWTYRNDKVRLISARKANKREVSYYEKSKD